MNNSDLKISGSLLEDRGPIEIHTRPEWQPVDGERQYLIYDHITLTLPDNPSNIHFNGYYIDLALFNTRTLALMHINSYYHDQNHMVYPVHQIFGSPNLEVHIINCTFVNVICTFGGNMVTVAKLVNIENNLFMNTSDFIYATYNLLQIDTVNVSNVTHRNINGTGSSTEFFMIIDLNENGNSTFSSVNFYDWYIGVQKAIYFSGSMNAFIMNNSIFSNLIVGTRNSIMSAALVSMISITNWTFTSISPSSKFDENNMIINIENLNLANSMNSTIKDIYVQSSISFLAFNSVVGKLNSPISFTISNIEFNNSILNRDTSIISFGNMESQEDISYLFTNLTFKSISFNGNGDLMKFQHQFIKNFIVVSYSTFSNIIGGDIYLEAANKNNFGMKTFVKLQNCTFDNINDNFKSLIVVNEGGNLHIDDCTFNNISTYESGSIVSAGYQKAYVEITNSNFTNNYAISGGVFYVESESLILVQRWNIISNFAITSGVIQVSNNGYFQIYNSIIANNYALSSSLSAIIDTARESLIESSNIFSNFGITISSFLDEINLKWEKLWYLSVEFKNYIKNNPKLYSITTSNYVFSLILGKLTLKNNVQIYNQNSIFESFESTFVGSNLAIFNVSNAQLLITASSSTVNLQDVEIYRVLTSNEFPLIKVAFESNLNINNLHYYSSQVPFLSTYSANVTANNVLFEDCNSTDTNPPLSFDQSEKLMFTNWTINKVNASNSDYILKVSNSYLEGNKIVFMNLKQTPGYFINDKISQVIELKVSNCSRGLIIENSEFSLLSKSSFSNSGSTNITNGGAVYIHNSNITISESSFTTNLAIEGGAISFDCLTSMFCEVTISNSSFINNTAIKKGGAIAYSLFRPKMINNTFSGNLALYGNNVGSYVTQIYIYKKFNQSIVFENVGSGITVKPFVQPP